MRFSDFVVNFTITVLGCVYFFLPTSAFANIDSTFYQLNPTVVDANFIITDVASDQQSVFFIAQESIDEFRSSSSNWLWRLDKQSNSYSKLSFKGPDLPFTEFANIEVISGQAFFLAADANNQQKLWSYELGCQCISVVDGEKRLSRHLFRLDDQLFMHARDEDLSETIWLVDAQSGAISVAGNDSQGALNGAFSDFVFSDNAFYFTAQSSSGGTQFWQYDQLQNSFLALDALNQLVTQNAGRINPRIVAVVENRLYMDTTNIETVDPWEEHLEGELWAWDVGGGDATKITDLYFSHRCDADDSITEKRKTLLSVSGDYVFYVNIEDTSAFSEDYENLPSYHIWRYDFATGEKVQITNEQFHHRTRSWCSTNAISHLTTADEQLYFAWEQNSQPDSSALYSFKISDDMNDAELTFLGDVAEANGLKRKDDRLFLDPVIYSWKGSLACNQVVDLSSNSLMTIDYNGQQQFCRNTFLLQDEIIAVAGESADREQLWRVDSNLLGHKLTDIQPTRNRASNVNEGITVGDNFYFVAESGTEGRGLWRLGATGEPVSLPFVSDANVTPYSKELLLEKAINHYLFFSAPIDGSKQYFRLDSRDDSIIPLEDLNRTAQDRGLELSLFQHSGDKVVFRHRSRNNVSQVFSYDLVTQETKMVFWGDGQVTWIDEDNVYLFRDVDFYYGLWRWDRSAREYMQIETSPVRGCNKTKVVDGAAFGESIYFSRWGDVMRYNPVTQEFAQLGCGNHLLPTSSQMLVVLEEGFVDGFPRASLWQVNDEINQVKRVSPVRFKDDWEFINGKFYYAGKDEQNRYGLWRYNPADEQLALLNDLTGLNSENSSDLQPGLFKLTELSGQVYFISYLQTRYQGAVSEMRLWQGGGSQPLVNFNNSTFAPTEEDYMLFLKAFAGDLFLPGTVNQQGVHYQSALIRLEINANTIALPQDFDGDGKADIALRDPSQRLWTIYQSSNEQIRDKRFGLRESDIPVPADYDGDGSIDIAVRRPDTKMWYILNSSNSNYGSDREDGIQRIQFGLAKEDIPVVADYDGDGIADLAVRRPSLRAWIIRQSSDGEIIEVKFGQRSTDIPVAGDFDGDGKADIAFRRPESKIWYVKNSSGSNYNSDREDAIQRTSLGLAEDDIPVSGDFDGDSITDMAVWRARSSLFIIRLSETGQIIEKHFDGASTALPIVADYNGDGFSDTAVYHRETGVVDIRFSNSGSQTSQQQRVVAPGLYPVALPTSQLIHLLSER